MTWRSPGDLRNLKTLMPHTARPFFIQATCTIREAMARMDRGGRGIVLVTDHDDRLTGTVTDGDVRRAILARLSLDEPVETLLRRKSGAYAHPITAPVGTGKSEQIRLIQKHRIQHLPLVDDEGRVESLVTLDELLPSNGSIGAVVMAGGRGTRLMPLTEDLPKPMLPIGDRPLMELIIDRLRDAGITDVCVTTHHMAEKITSHFGDGSGFGVRLSYVAEDQPLGTAGSLALMPPLKDTTLVMNGDILTEVDFRHMLAFHREHEADLTLAIRHYEVKVPFGAVECEGAVVTGLSEKPVQSFFVNAGIYLVEPEVQRYIPRRQRFDMTDLIQRLLEERRPVISFPILEDWLDIGQHSDYALAQEQASRWSVKA